MLPVRDGALRIAALVLLLAGIFLATNLLATDAAAHESRPAYLQITETAPSQFELLWRTPTRGALPLPVVLQLPHGIHDIRSPQIDTLSDSRLERRWIAAGPEGLAGARIGFRGLEFTITEAIVRGQFLDGQTWMAIARPQQPWVEIEGDRSRVQVFGQFVRRGVEHILFGVDHLLFVFGLLLLMPNLWMLVKTITAFTVAHSITLAAATLGFLRPPAGPVEAAIALSIVFLGVEIVRAHRGETSLAIRHPWVVAFAFGLLHGFGFAGALSAAGLPPTDIPLVLLAFNVGVEIGQLAFVGVCVLLAMSLRRVHLAPAGRLIQVPAYAVGSLGAFWLFQRLALF